MSLVFSYKVEKMFFKICLYLCLSVGKYVLHRKCRMDISLYSPEIMWNCIVTFTMFGGITLYKFRAAFHFSIWFIFLSKKSKIYNIFCYFYSLISDIPSSLITLIFKNDVRILPTIMKNIEVRNIFFWLYVYIISRFWISLW